MANPLGRPMKYRKFIEILEDNEVYTAGTILKLGLEHGLLAELGSPEENNKARIRIRHALARFKSNHNFPRDGDGSVTVPGQAPIPGWFGQRWKASLPKIKKQS